MKRSISIALAILIAFSLVLMPAVNVVAAPQKIQVSGTFVLDSYVPYKIIESGPNLIYFMEMGAIWSGDLQGSDSGFGIEVDRANGRYVFNTITTWEGTIMGDMTGTMQITTTSRGLYGEAGPLWLTGTMTLVGLSGDLDGVHGKITFDSMVAPFTIAYSGWIMFKP
jgi:hypothetical protein